MNVMTRVFKVRLSRSIWGNIMLLLLMVLLGCYMALPLVYAISTSLKPLSELWYFPPRFFVQNPTTENFTSLVKLMNGSLIPFTRYFFNTFLYTLLGTAGQILICSMCAYPLAKYQFPLSRAFYGLVVTALMFSEAVTGIPNYMIMAKLGMIDTMWAVVLPSMGGALGLFLMKQFMEQNIPSSLLDSAEIDGANEWVKFSRIVMPLVKPAWLTLMIFCVQSLWGNNKNSTTYIYSEQKKTLSFAFSQLQQSGAATAGVAAAVTVVMLAVPLFIFILCQSKVIETMATSGLKD